MGGQGAKSLLEESGLLPSLDTVVSLQMVPFHDHALFLELATHAVEVVGRFKLDKATLVLDAHSAIQLQGIVPLMERAQSVVILGAVPERWENAANVTSHPRYEHGKCQEQVFCLCAQRVQVLIAGQARPSAAQESPLYDGGWTFRRELVLRLLDRLGLSTGASFGGDEPDRRQGESEILALELMRCQAGLQETLQRDIAMDKNDLFSVLNILKAISAKRRAHDVLFVFVEQIARVVNAERCSVVRVWGSENIGQVLASHEDATVNHREIQLSKYPELLAALDTREKIVISDVRTHPLTQEFAELLEHAQIRALLVIPIVLFDQTIGSLFLRAARRTGTFTVREISFFEVVAEAAANALERAHLFESIQIANERLERLAVTDGLTGLYNHRFCRDRLEEEFQRAMRYKVPLSCILFDVDNFKRFNDTYGHLLGDSILREMADRTQQCIRKSDLVARYGGEEFIVIMPQTDAEGAFAEGERLRRSIALPPFTDVPDGVPVTVSVGVATLDASTMRNYDDIIRAADMALYEAKRLGKNRVASYSQDTSQGRTYSSH